MAAKDGGGGGPITPNTNLEVKTKFTGMIEDFKKQLEVILDQAKTSLNEMTTAANTNFDAMAEAYRSGSNEMRAQVLKGNLGMVESFRKNSKVVQQSIDDAYRTLTDENMTQFTGNMGKFEAQFKTALSKAPSLSSSRYSEVIKELKAKQKAVLESTNYQYKIIVTNFMDNVDTTAKQLTLSLADLSTKKKK